MQVLCLYGKGKRKSKARAKSELRSQQYNVTLFDWNHLAHVIVLWQCKKLCVTVQFLLCFILNLRAISKGLYLEGRFNGGFFCYEFGGLIFGVYFQNFTVYYFWDLWNIHWPCKSNFFSCLCHSIYFCNFSLLMYVSS